MNKNFRDVLDAAARSHVPDNLNLYPRIAANLEERHSRARTGITIMQTLRARPALLIVMVLLALGLLTGVAYAVGRSLGYIPGVGLVEQGAPIRVLAEPVSLTRDGITVTVTAAVLTSDKSTFVYSVENVPFSAYSHNENVSGCYDMAKIMLPAGGALFFRDGSGSSIQTRASFSEIPTNVNEATFILPCIQDTLPGLAPENWQLPLRFKPAPADMTVVPVVEIQPTATLVPTGLTGAPVVEAQNTATSTPTSLYGASITVDRFIPIEDGYYLIGHTEWNDDRLKNLQIMRITGQDASGREVLMEVLDAQNSGLNLIGNQWVYHIFGKVFKGPLTFRANEVLIEFKNPVLYQIDLRPFQFKFDDSQLGIPYKTGIKTLDVPGILASAFKATYTNQGDLRGFEIAMKADPELRNLSFRIASALDTSGMRQVAGSSGSFRDESTGLLLARVLTDAKMSFPLVLAVDSANISGNWETIWNPPAPPSGATPVYAPQACLDLEHWKNILKNPPMLPTGLPARAMVLRGALLPNPSLFLQNLDGSNEQPLVFGSGSLSPDGSRLVYSDENENIQILELASGQKHKISGGVNNTPIWSPDGKRIAYLHQTGQGMNIFVVEADGSNQTALTELAANPELRGWTPDGRNLLIVANQGMESQIALLDTATREIKPLIHTYGLTWDVTASLSPDGQWLAYSEKVTGRIGAGIYISRLDGSEKRLLVQLDYWPAFSPVWSPDGKWLAFNAINNDLPDGSASAGVINVDTCQVVPLPAIQGEIHGWVR